MGVCRHRALSAQQTQQQTQALGTFSAKNTHKNRQVPSQLCSALCVKTAQRMFFRFLKFGLLSFLVGGILFYFCSDWFVYFDDSAFVSGRSFKVFQFNFQQAPIAISIEAMSYFIGTLGVLLLSGIVIQRLKAKHANSGT